MGMSEFYGAADEAEAVATIHRALELGVTLLDTADMYGSATTSSWSAARSPTGATRSCWRPSSGSCATGRIPRAAGSTGGPDYVHAGLRRFAAPARASTTSISTTSTASIPTSRSRRRSARWPSSSTPARSDSWVSPRPRRRRSAAPTPSTRSPPADRVFALEPGHRGGGAADDPRAGHRPGRLQPAGPGLPDRRDQAPRGPRRRRLPAHSPRFQGENFARNLELVERVREIAAEQDCTPGQLALAWVLHQGDDVVPIPGTKRRSYLEENVEATEISLSAEDLAAARRGRPGRGGRRRALSRHVADRSLVRPVTVHRDRSSGGKSAIRACRNRCVGVYKG